MFKKEQQATASVHFTEVMAKKRENIIFERMDKLRQEIEQQGQKLAKSQTIEDFRKYKQLVKSFMEDAVNNGLQLKNNAALTGAGARKYIRSLKKSIKANRFSQFRT
ncbi:DUF327 family protein [Bacillus sp. N9]